MLTEKGLRRLIILSFILLLVLFGCGKKIQRNAQNSPQDPENTCTEPLSGELIRHELDPDNFYESDETFWEVKASGGCAHDYLVVRSDQSVFFLSEKKIFRRGGYPPGPAIKQEILLASVDLSRNRIQEIRVFSDPFPVLEDSAEPRLECEVVADPISVDRIDIGGGVIKDGPVPFVFTITATLDEVGVAIRLKGFEQFGIGQTVDITDPDEYLNLHEKGYSAAAFGGHELSFLVEDELGSSATCASEEVYVNSIPPELESLEIIPDDISMPLGLSQAFIAMGAFTDYSVRDVTDQVIWTSEFPAVAQIGDSPGSKGWLSTVSTGTTTISITLNDIPDSMIVTVIPAEVASIQVSPSSVSLPLGRDQNFTANATYTDSSQRDVTDSVTWESSNGSVASISNAGYLTTLGTGSTTIKATLGSVFGSAGVTVTAAELVSIEISPEDISMAPGASEQFSATGVKTDQSTVDVTALASWTSSVTGVATISNSGPTKGLATAVDAGSTDITVNYGGFNDSTTLTVYYRQLYFFYTAAGDFDLTINDIIGTNHYFSDFDFKNQSFKLYIEERLLSRINYGGKNGYLASDISATDNTTLDSHTEIFSINRHFADRDSTNPPPCTIVPDPVFANRRVDRARVESGGTFVDLSGQTAPVYLFKDQLRERWGYSGQNCYPTIHSSRRTAFGQVTSAPTFTGYPWASDGYVNTYGNGAYVYVDAGGDLHLRYKTQTSYSRAVFMIGIISNE